LLAGIVEIERRVFRYPEKTNELLRPLDAEMRSEDGRLPVVRKMLVKFLVLSVGDLVLRSLPERPTLVDRLPLWLFAGLAFGLCLELDGIGDVIRVAADELAQAPGVEQLLVLLLQEEADFGSSCCAVRWLDVERIAPRRRPLPRLVRSRRPRHDLDAF